jgi:hypothetical protein
VALFHVKYVCDVAVATSCMIHPVCAGSATVSNTQDPALIPAGQGCGLFPFNVANPMVAVSGNRVAVVGGEINTRKIGKTMYQHDSQSALLGAITVL